MQSSSKRPEYTVNGRGDRVSAKREVKRLFKKRFNITSGRQYRIMRKKLQRGQLDEHFSPAVEPANR